MEKNNFVYILWKIRAITLSKNVSFFIVHEVCSEPVT